MRFDSTVAFGKSKRHSLTFVACSEKSAKFTPVSAIVAPSGDGRPGQILVAVMARVLQMLAAYLDFNYLAHLRQLRWQPMAALNKSGKSGALIVFPMS